MLTSPSTRTLVQSKSFTWRDGVEDEILIKGAALRAGSAHSLHGLSSGDLAHEAAIVERVGEDA